jgi:hypothetical protein
MEVLELRTPIWGKCIFDTSPERGAYLTIGTTAAVKNTAANSYPGWSREIGLSLEHRDTGSKVGQPIIERQSGPKP